MSSSWVDPTTHGWVHHPSSAQDWSDLLARYGGSTEEPLARVLGVARAHRCRTVVEENRYVDADYRSEYAAFWSRRFAAKSPFTRRLHFFRRVVADEHLHTDAVRDGGYVGYSTLKPLWPGRIGRTVLAPPPRLRRATMALSRDRVSLFGTPLEVEGAPFLEQDQEYLRCAHAAVWTCHYAAALRGLVGRRLTADLVDLAPKVLDYERALPSQGLNLNQIQEIFRATGQPALFYGLSKMPDVWGIAPPSPTTDPEGRLLPGGFWDTRLFSVVCRYLNSGFPVLIGTTLHAFVIVGWFRDGKRIRFVACDDQWGPYEVIGSPFTDRRAPWVSVMVPLPPRVYLSAEQAESAASFVLRNQNPSVALWSSLTQMVDRSDISFRTFLRSNAAYKAALRRQGRGDEAVRLLSLARLPHFVWVVEAQRRDLRDAGLPPVIAEVVFDSSSSDKMPSLSALTLPGLARTAAYDHESTPASAAGSLDPWRSQRDIETYP